MHLTGKTLRRIFPEMDLPLSCFNLLNLLSWLGDGGNLLYIWERSSTVVMRSFLRAP
jgi:hypothetical protein